MANIISNYAQKKQGDKSQGIRNDGHADCSLRNEVET